MLPIKLDSNKQHEHVQKTGYKLFASNYNESFSNIVTTEKSNQGDRATLKAFSYVFHVHYLFFFDVRQHGL